MDVARLLAMGRRWWWLLIMGALFSVAAYGVATRLHHGPHPTPTYAATTTLYATLPPLPDSAFSADPAKRPWELDRLMGTYAQMARSRTTAERAIYDANLPTSADDLAARIDTSTFGYTQLLGITVSAAAPGEADRSVAAVVRAFGEIRAEHGIPGETVTFERLPAVRTDHPPSKIVNLAIVVLAGVLASAAIVLAFEYAGAVGGAGVDAQEQVGAQESGGAGRAPSTNERAI